jgi:hypothetical protein
VVLRKKKEEPQRLLSGWERYLLREDLLSEVKKNLDILSEIKRSGILPCVELVPPFTQAEDVSPLATFARTENPRTFEIWKEEDRVRVVICAPDFDLSSYRLVYPDLRAVPAPLRPSWVDKISDGNPPIVFDVEYSHSLPFSAHQVPQNWVEEVIASLPREAWIQVAVEQYDWSQYAEDTANAIQTYVQYIDQGLLVAPTGKRQRFPPEEEAGKLGPRLAKEALVRAHTSRPILVHIRAMVRGSESDILALQGALCNIRIGTDSLAAFDASHPNAIWWMTDRAMYTPDPELEVLSKFTFSKRGVAPWGQGRELICGLLMDESELPNLIRLPENKVLKHLFAEKKRGLARSCERDP